jgi:hypothetical protein
LGDGVTDGSAQGGDLTGMRRAERVFHLHRFGYGQDLPGGHLITVGHPDAFVASEYGEFALRVVGCARAGNPDRSG